MKTARELRGENEALVKRMTVLSSKNMSAEERAEFEVLEDGIEKRRERIARLEGRDLDIDKLQERAFGRYLRYGMNSQHRLGISSDDSILLRRESRDMGTGGGNALQGSGGGYFVPVGFANRVESAMKFHSDLWASSTIIPTQTGGKFPYPVANDTGITGEMVQEAAQVTTGDISPLSSVVFGTFKFSSRMIKVSVELAEDAWFDFESYLAEIFAVRLARASTPLFTNGTGVAQPTGIMTAATASGVVVRGDSNATTPDPTMQIGYPDLVALEMSLDASYRRKGQWLMASSTLAYLKGLVDKSGRPMFPDLSDRTPDDAAQRPWGTLLGYNVRVCESMDSVGSGKKPLAFGDLSKYAIRDVRNMQVMRLSERFSDYGQIAYVAWARWDANLLNTQAVKYLTMGA